jgi:hypothetical protein
VARRRSSRSRRRRAGCRTPRPTRPGRSSAPRSVMCHGCLASSPPPAVHTYQPEAGTRKRERATSGRKVGRSVSDSARAMRGDVPGGAGDLARAPDRLDDQWDRRGGRAVAVVGGICPTSLRAKRPHMIMPPSRHRPRCIPCRATASRAATTAGGSPGPAGRSTGCAVCGLAGASWCRLGTRRWR